MAESRNSSELLWAWQGWRTNVARRIKPLYLEVSKKYIFSLVLQKIVDNAKKLKYKDGESM